MCFDCSLNEISVNCFCDCVECKSWENLNFLNDERKSNLETDRGGLWEILCPIIRQGETYAFPRDWDEETAI
jgi:hypothetical protein